MTRRPNFISENDHSKVAQTSNTIDEYIAGFPKDVQRILQEEGPPPVRPGSTGADLASLYFSLLLMPTNCWLGVKIAPDRIDEARTIPVRRLRRL